LFFVAGFLSTRVGLPEVERLGGVIHHAPLLTGTFLVIALAGVGLPGTNGFNGEHLVMLGAYQQHWSMAVASGLGVFLTAAYLQAFFVRGFMGASRPEVVAQVPDLSRGERGIVLVLVALIFWIGLATGPFIQAIRPSLTLIEEQFQNVSSAPVTAGYDESVRSR
jgi:NADH-quinone oxidoreductase subunit M